MEEIADLKGKILKERIPNHIAIIMDGNGRWAKRRNFERIRGHLEGTDSTKRIVRCAVELNINILTLYTFSSENWQRPQEEIDALMDLLKAYLLLEMPQILEADIKFKAIGDLKMLPEDILKIIQEVEEKSKANHGLLLNLALSYGGRGEILKAIKDLFLDLQKGKITLDNINEETFPQYLYTSGIPDPDLLIRTSGEFRLSNFLLWQLAYTEIYITPTLWPDFKEKDFYLALIAYQNRERRFGSINDRNREKKAL